MRKHLYISLLGLSFVWLDCYTILQPSRPTDFDRAIEEMFSKNVVLDENLIGYWTKEQMVIDNGIQVEMLHFSFNGRIVYDPHSEKLLPTHQQTGRFKTVFDTLIIHFERKDFVERYLYAVNDDFTLSLQSLRVNKDESYSVIKYRQEYPEFWKRRTN